MMRLPAALQAFDVVSSVIVYRQIGRRPSRVYVDQAMTAVDSGVAEQRLSDRVYWRTVARPGDQIQHRPGGMLVVTPEGECYPIILAEPTPLTPTTAFTHADMAFKADQSVLEQLAAAGSLVETSPRQPKTRPLRPADRMFPESHPLLLEELPHGITWTEDGGSAGRASGTWTRHRPR